MWIWCFTLLRAALFDIHTHHNHQQSDEALASRCSRGTRDKDSVLTFVHIPYIYYFYRMRPAPPAMWVAGGMVPYCTVGEHSSRVVESNTRAVSHVMIGLRNPTPYYHGERNPITVLVLLYGPGPGPLYDSTARK